MHRRVRQFRRPARPHPEEPPKRRGEPPVVPNLREPSQRKQIPPTPQKTQRTMGMVQGRSTMPALPHEVRHGGTSIRAPPELSPHTSTRHPNGAETPSRDGRRSKARIGGGNQKTCQGSNRHQVSIRRMWKNILRQGPAHRTPSDTPMFNVRLYRQISKGPVGPSRQTRESNAWREKRQQLHL